MLENGRKIEKKKKKSENSIRRHLLRKNANYVPDGN